MVPSGNSYDDATNTMTAGSVDNCLPSSTANNAQHNHTAHLIIQNVEDLVGWQARLYYDGSSMRPHTINYTPFVDSTTSQNVSFANLPLDGGAHRELLTATNIPPQAARPQTGLIGAVYIGAQNFAVSPDTPAKKPPDDSTYSAPSGGVLAAVNLQVLSGQLGHASLYVDLDDNSPNTPGSGLAIFTDGGTIAINPGESSLGDGFHSEGVPCVPVAPPPLPSGPPFHHRRLVEAPDLPQPTQTAMASPTPSRPQHTLIRSAAAVPVPGHPTSITTLWSTL